MSATKEQLDNLINNISHTFRNGINNLDEYNVNFHLLIETLCKIGKFELTRDQRDYVFEEVRDSISYSLSEIKVIKPRDYFDESWLEREDINFEYSDRYFEYLEKKKNWNTNTVEVLKKSSFNLAKLLGNPKGKGEMHRKGLLIGDVQSGKTSNYVAVMNRAVDIGFDVIVLLAGTTSVLRRQTQKRIDQDLVGKENNKTSVGVGLLNGKKLSKITTATTQKGDYRKSSQGVSLEIREGTTILFVTKKNVSTLKAIKEALETNRESEDEKINGSLLLIDDEADNASVDTTKEDKDPTAINRAIRDLLHMFSRTSYFAVTATPFANIFIDDDLKKEFHEDLFPSDFIALTDSPYNYTGAQQLFGEEEIHNSEKILGYSTTYSDFCIRDIDPNEMEDTYKFKHKKDVRIRSFNDLPYSLQYSVRYFILVQQLMDLLPGVDIHRTMMINVSRYVDVQDNLFKVLTSWLEDELKPQVRKNANYPLFAEEERSGEFYQLKKVWDSEELERLSGLSWMDFSPQLLKNISKLRVAVVNNGKISKDGNGLAYESNKEGDRVIAVGGQCLSRGLTLEGLVVSYFYRNSAAYDTLLQMGRWFGYRSAYIKYFRIWMPEISQRWYELISDACEDLKDQIRINNNKNLIPAEYGLAVQKHPYTGLIVTAKNKMRHAKQSDKKIITDLRGKLIEAPRLLVNKDDNKHNAILVDKLFDSITTKLIEDESGLGYYWKDISREQIADFIMKYRSSKLSLGFSVDQLSGYIRSSSSEMWDVAIAQSGDKGIGSFRIKQEDIDFKLIERPFEASDGEVISIYGRHARIGTGPVTRLGLNQEEVALVESLYPNSEWKTKKQRYSTYLFSYDDRFKRNCILLLYPLSLYLRKEGQKKIKLEDREYYNDSDIPIVWGIGLGFAGAPRPDEKEESYYTYMLNPVAQKLWAFGEDSEEDDISDISGD